jgi:hypothetical protein
VGGQSCKSASRGSVRQRHCIVNYDDTVGGQASSNTAQHWKTAKRQAGGPAGVTENRGSVRQQQQQQQFRGPACFSTVRGSARAVTPHSTAGQHRDSNTASALHSTTNSISTAGQRQQDSTALPESLLRVIAVQSRRRGRFSAQQGQRPWPRASKARIPSERRATTIDRTATTARQRAGLAGLNPEGATPL